MYKVMYHHCVEDVIMSGLTLEEAEDYAAELNEKYDTSNYYIEEED